MPLFQDDIPFYVEILCFRLSPLLSKEFPGGVRLGQSVERVTLDLGMGGVQGPRWW